jgi:hypothetical protein
MENREVDREDRFKWHYILREVLFSYSSASIRVSRTEKMMLTLFAKSYRSFTGHQQVMDDNCSFSARWIDCQFSYVINLIILIFISAAHVVFIYEFGYLT